MSWEAGILIISRYWAPLFRRRIMKKKGNKIQIELIEFTLPGFLPVFASNPQNNK